MFELHVWGPAFGFPSIDPVCLAAVAYFNRIVPRDQWTLIADYDPSLSPQGEFPLLVVADCRITGFTNIVAYLGEHYNLDVNLKQQQQTDRTALISFLESTAGPLLDLYLYVSSENYHATTTAAYTAILPWFANYTLPPKRLDLARSKTAHLGLSSLDVAEASEDTRGPGRGTSSSEFEAAKRAAGIPTEERAQTLNMGRGKGVGGLLRSPIYAARFKLDALSSELLQPLADQLGKKDYIFGGNKPSSIDCLVFGYLALLRYAPVPQAWVRETIETKFPKLDGYINRMREELLHSEDIKAADVWAVATGRSTARESGLQLPWSSRSSRAILPQILGTLHDAALPQVLQSGAIVKHEKSNVSRNRRSALPSPLTINTLATFTSAVVIGLAALAIHHRKTPREGPLIFWALQPLQSSLDGFGVESFLSALPR